MGMGALLGAGRGKWPRTIYRGKLQQGWAALAGKEPRGGSNSCDIGKNVENASIDGEGPGCFTERWLRFCCIEVDRQLIIPLYQLLAP